MANLASPAPLGDPNGNNDSGYAPSQTDATESPKKPRFYSKKNGATLGTELRYLSFDLSIKKTQISDFRIFS